MTALLVVIAAAGSACSIHTRDVARYAGTLATPGPGCPALRSTLIVQEDQAVFSPGEATWSVAGKVANGHLAATRSRPSFEGKTYATTLDATVADDAVQGTYSTPTCKYTVQLRRF